MTSEDYSDLLQKIEQIATNVERLKSGLTHKPLYTIEETCELLHISKRTLQKYRDEGMIPFTQVRNKIYFRDTDIEEFLANHKVEPYK